MTDVFISYASIDKEFTNGISTQLEQSGITCWLAPRDIKPGEEYAEGIMRGIDTSDCMVIIFSEASNKSKHVLREVERAVTNEKVIIPFRISNAEPSGSMDYFLKISHWLDAMDMDEEQALTELRETIIRITGKTLKTTSKNPSLKKTNSEIIPEPNAIDDASLKPLRKLAEKALLEDGHITKIRAKLVTMARMKGIHDIDPLIETLKKELGEKFIAVETIHKLINEAWDDDAITGEERENLYAAGEMSGFAKKWIDNKITQLKPSEKSPPQTSEEHKKDAEPSPTPEIEAPWYRSGKKIKIGLFGAGAIVIATFFFIDKSERDLRNKNDDAEYAGARAIDTYQSYVSYRKRYPSGRHYYQASTQINTMKSDTGKANNLYKDKKYKLAFETYKKPADRGYPPAQVYVGYQYFYGLGVDKDQPEANEWWLKCANLKNINCMYWLGKSYKNGTGITQSFSKAKLWFSEGQKLNNSRSIMELASLYRDKKWSGKDINEALKLYQSEASKNKIAAILALARMYRFGDDVTQNFDVAKSWYMKGIDLKNVSAITSLAVMHTNKKWTGRTPSEVVRLFKLGAAKNDTYSMYRLGHSYHYGIDITQNFNEANKWYLEGIKGNNTSAIVGLGRLYKNAKWALKNYKESMRLFSIAEKKGNGFAMFEIGQLYRYGQGVTKNYNEAKKWYDKAATKGQKVKATLAALKKEFNR